MLPLEQHELYRATTATLPQQHLELGFLNDVAIPIVNEFKFLGLIYDKKTELHASHQIPEGPMHESYEPTQGCRSH